MGLVKVQVVTREIHSCDQCTFYHETRTLKAKGFYVHESKCTKTGKVLKGVEMDDLDVDDVYFPVPEWCPLPDKGTD